MVTSRLCMIPSGMVVYGVRERISLTYGIRKIIVVLITGTLVGIADVWHKIVGDVESLFEFSLVFFCGAGHLYPAVWLPLTEVAQFARSIPICFHVLILHVNEMRVNNTKYA